MANTVEAAEEIEVNIEATKRLVEKMKKLRSLGPPASVGLDDNIVELEKIIAKNEAMAQYIRDTAE